MRVGLVGRVLLGAGIPTLLAVAAFAAMVSSIVELRTAQWQASRSQALVIAAGELSRAVNDVTAARRDLRPDDPARATALDNAVRGVTRRSAVLTAMATRDPDERVRIIELASSAEGYATTGRSADGVFVSLLDAFLKAERDTVSGEQKIADSATRRAIVAAGAGLVLSIGALAGLGVYFTRVVTLPLRHASAMAREFADGNLAARLPSAGTGEILDLQVALNDMAGALGAAQAQLAASRSRIVAEQWQTRRELERNLHDGLQQRLVALSIDVRALSADLEGPPRDQADRIGSAIADATEELRDIARGIQPAVLTQSGLASALRALARRSALPVEVKVDLAARPAPDIESAAYYFTAEAITNTVKHARASYVSVDVRKAGDSLTVVVSDDGIGGATSAGGTGLLGLRDRVEAAGGTMTIDSQPDCGTILTASLPLA